MVMQCAMAINKYTDRPKIYTFDEVPSKLGLHEEFLDKEGAMCFA